MRSMCALIGAVVFLSASLCAIAQAGSSTRKLVLYRPTKRTLSETAAFVAEALDTIRAPRTADVCRRAIATACRCSLCTLSCCRSTRSRVTISW